MGSSYPNFRRAQRGQPPRGRRAPQQRRSRSSFIGQLLGGSVIVAAIGWGIAPRATSTYTQVTSSPAENRRREQSLYYRNCAAARAAGAAPIYRGQPGYRPELDGDSDGVACEPVPRR